MRVLSAVALAALLLAGCTGPSDPGAPTGSDGAPAVAKAASIPAPTWTLGQSWTQEWVLVSDAFEFTVLSVVAEASPASYTVATPNLEMAAIHGAFTIPTLGTFQADGTRIARSDGGFWPWYVFPIRENVTATLPMSTKDGSGGLTSQLWFIQAHNVTAQRADFVARADAPNGPVVARYDYDNATGWFREARFYDTGGNMTFIGKVTATGVYKGTAYDATAGHLLADAAFQVVPLAQSVDGENAAEFSPGGADTHLLAFPYAFAAGGAAASALVAPNGTAYPVHTDPVEGAGEAGTGTGELLVVPSQPGSWRIAMAGAGAYAAGGGVQVFGVTVRTLTV